MKQILPQLPILSSSKEIWEGIRAEHLLHPTGGTSECCLPHYTISIHLGRPIQLEQVADGHCVHECISYVDIIVSPPHLHRRLRWDRKAELFILRLEPTFFARAVDEGSDRIELIPQIKLHDPLIQQIGLALKAELDVGCPSGSLYGESLTTALAVHLLKQNSTTKPNIRDYEDGLSRYKLNQALEYINAHLDQEIKLSSIAEVVGISQYYFCRLFKQSMGMTPYQYVIQQRVERAKQLLQQRNVMIADVARAVGFADQSQFTRHFKRLLGVTPKQFFRK